MKPEEIWSIWNQVVDVDMGFDPVPFANAIIDAVPAIGLERISQVLACEIECGIFEQHVAPALDIARKTLVEPLYSVESQQDAAIEAKPAEQSAWQPIETAPKDGTPLLLFARCKRATASIILIGWHLADLGWIECAFAPNMPIGIVPTLWMPLPTFPGHAQVESQRGNT